MNHIKTNKQALRIVFMGTPIFAVESLKALVDNGYNIVGVVTMPDKPAGRGYNLQQSPVKQYALKQGLKVLQPEKLKAQEFIDELKKLQADLQIVVAFRMLPEIVWSMPTKGTFNLHSSLLPRYRGAAPINWAIINGEKETGVTTFFLSHEIDTGEIIFQEKISIGENETAGSLHDRLMTMGASLVLKTTESIINGSITTISQTDLIERGTQMTLAPKIFTEDCHIDWNNSVDKIHNLIRGLSPYPAAWTELYTDREEKPIRVKIYGCNIVYTNKDKNMPPHKQLPGTIVTDNKTQLNVVTNNGYIEITDLQLSGKKRLTSKDLLNGFKLSKTAYFL